MIASADTFTVDVLQYMRSDGRRQHVCTDLPIASKPAYLQMLKDGCLFEIEVLQTAEVSITIANINGDLDIEVVPNGPEVQEAMVKMLARGWWQLE